MDAAKKLPLCSVPGCTKQRRGGCNHMCMTHFGKSMNNHLLLKAGGTEIPHEHDILCCRGGASNNHPGNKVYLTVVQHNKSQYNKTPKHDKTSYANAIVDTVLAQNPPGRFLQKKDKKDKENDKDNLWYEVARKRAVEKTVQALGEKKETKVIPRSLMPPDFVHLTRGEPLHLTSRSWKSTSAVGSCSPASLGAVPFSGSNHAPRPLPPQGHLKSTSDANAVSNGHGSNEEIVCLGATKPKGPELDRMRALPYLAARCVELKHQNEDLKKDLAHEKQKNMDATAARAQERYYSDYILAQTLSITLFSI